MAASKNNNAHKPELTLPSSIAQTMRLVQRVAHSATWGERIARHHQPPTAADFGPRLFRRFDAANAPGQWANAFAQRFVADELPPSSSALTLAPHAPAQRQVSAARQGALNWSGGDRFSSPASSFGGGPIDRFADADASHSLISDLMGNGWGVQSARPDTLRRFAEPASPEPAPASRSNAAQAAPNPAPIHRSPAPTALAQPQPNAPIRRSPESPSSAPAQSPATVNRQADAPTAAASESNSVDSVIPEPSPATADARPVQRSVDSAADTPSTAASTTTASEDAAPIETAGTRPMTFFQGAPQSPLMRMGLSDLARSGDAPTGPATINRQPASGELPVVRPARGNDEPSFSAPTSGAINRRAEQPPTAPSTQITSSDTIERTAASDVDSNSTAPAEIQRTASDAPTTAASEPQAAASNVAQPEVQRQAAAESSAPVADSLINRSEPAAPTTAADTTSTTTVAPVQRSEAPTSGSTSGSAEVTAAPASSDSAPASDSAAAQTTSAAGVSAIARSTSDAAPATPTVQRTADVPGESSTTASTKSASDAGDTSTADTTTTAESPGPVVRAPAQRTPMVQRKPVQPVRASSIDTVLPLASSLMRRYSAGSAQGTSGSMPLLRTFVPTPAAVMRSPAPITPITGATQTSGNTSTSASSAASPSLPPLVHRSPIVPLLPTATLQREPAATATASAASPAPRAATPALEWSALPLLQRLSTAHALPATPAASASATGGISVAAQVINRLAIDQPGAAPMPLLRVQAPSIARTSSESAPSAALMRSPDASTADSSPGISADTPASQSFTHDDGGTASPGFSAQPAPISAGFGVQSAPAIHRSAILPSLSSAAFQPLTLLRMHVPDAPSMAQADAPAGNFPLQRTPDAPSSTAPIASPIMMRAAEQPSFSALASGSGDRTGSTPTSASSATSPSLPPLVHRSPIVPLLPTATLQREPAASATASAASPAPRTATPALEWSALPLLQRLSGTHALPATSTASAAAPASGASVAAQVINRLAIDQPGAAPMPLLRMHTPTEAPLLSREAEAEAAERADRSVPNSVSESPTGQSSVMSSLVRRSPILAPTPSFASQAGVAGTMAAPVAETSGVTAQRSPADYAMPMLQRTSVQRFFGSRPALKLPSLGGIQNSVNSLAGQAQGMLGQVTSLPGQLQGQAQGMLDQVTGMPNQLMGQAQGMLDQVTGMPNQLMGQAQGMLDQVTGMPGQLMGQAQGMLDQVTGLPNQLMGQAQGMLDQVTGMPGQLMGQAQGMLDQVTGLPNQLMGQAQGMLDQVTGMPGQLMGQAQGMMNQVTGMPNQLMGQAQGMIAQASGFPGQLQGTASGVLGGRGAHMPLLRPTRGESHSAPIADELNPESEAKQADAQTDGAGAATGTKGPAGKQAKPDIEMLAQQVYARLRHRLLIDRERLGR